MIGLAARRGSMARARAVQVPAPMGSMNTVDAGLGMPPEDCVYRKNMIPADYGLRVRLGSREWCTGLTGGADNEVRGIYSFTGSVAANSKLFATTQTGIWDVTSSSASPTQVVAFGTSDATSGHGVAFTFSSAAGHFLCYFDESNGYYVYAESGGTWTAGGPSGAAVTGVNPANLVAGVMWKHRLWAIERGSGRGWYLDTANAIGGSATAYNFGAHFKQGGGLRQLASWTGDGGAGIDDQLVAVSDGGDVLIYAGENPTSFPTSFYLRGVWSVGGIPQGRRVISDFGGEALIQSTAGILPVSQLVTPKVVIQAGQYDTYKIANLWNRLQISTASLRGWAMAIHPLDGTLLVTVPQAVAQSARVLAMSLVRRGAWSEYTDLNCGIATVAHQNNLYFGTPDGKVKIMDGYVDGVTLADPNSYTPIPFSMLSAFQSMGSANQKRLGLVEASFIAEGGAPPHVVEARYRLDLSDITATILDATQPGSALWDSATWDSSVWAPEYTASQQMRGVTGIGPEVAIAIRGTAAARTILSAFRVSYTEGGLL